MVPAARKEVPDAVRFQNGIVGSTRGKEAVLVLRFTLQEGISHVQWMYESMRLGLYVYFRL
jgi:hypothetical protein